MEKHKKTVLIIDDETDLCLLLKNYLKKQQFEVYVSHTLEDGLKAFHCLLPDLVFLDNKLPDGFGWGVAPLLANSAPKTIFNLMTAYQPEIPPMPKNTKYTILEKPVSLLTIGRILENL